MYVYIVIIVVGSTMIITEQVVIIPVLLAGKEVLSARLYSMVWYGSMHACMPACMHACMHAWYACI